jgi:hypothetical protein
LHPSPIVIRVSIMEEDKMGKVWRRSANVIMFRESEWKIILVTSKRRWWDDIKMVV